MLALTRERGERATGHAPMKKVESRLATPLLRDLGIEAANEARPCCAIADHRFEPPAPAAR
jgi:hypothetical protein